MEGLVLEVLEPDERAPTRVKVDDFPATLGRAVDNTVVLDDPEVSGHHARIEEKAGQLVLLDSGSANGLFDLRTRKKVAEVPLSGRAKVRLGGTVIRFRSAAEPLERTVISRLTLLPEESVFEKRWLLALLCVATVGFYLLDEYLSSYRYVEAAKLLFGAVALLLVVATWSGAWGLVSKQLRRRFHFFEHAAVALSAALAAGVLFTARDFLSFSSASPWWPRLFGLASTAVVVGFLAYQHLRYCSPWTPRRLKVVSALLALVLVGTMQLYEVSNAPRFRSQPEFPDTMKPPAYQLARPQSLDEFFEGAKALKERADDAARRD